MNEVHEPHHPQHRADSGGESAAPGAQAPWTAPQPVEVEANAAYGGVATQNMPGPWAQPTYVPPRPRPLRGLSVATMLLLGATTVVGLVSAAHEFSFLGLADRIRTEPFTAELEADAARFDSTSAAIAGVMVLMLVASAVVYICWLWRARSNTEAYGWPTARRKQVWVVFGWFVPVVGLWFPLQIVSDVWKASHPRRASDDQDLSYFRGSALVAVWWFAYLLMLALSRVYAVVASGQTTTIANLETISLVGFVTDLSFAAAGVLAVLVVRQIDRFQTLRATSTVAWHVEPAAADAARIPPLRFAGWHRT